MDVTRPLSAAPGWLDIVTPIAVIVAAIVQKLDSTRVKKTLDRETEKHDEANRVRNQKLDDIHGLVNGTMLDQKKITMIFAKRIAELTQNQSDVLIASEAEREYLDHQRQIDPRR